MEIRLAFPNEVDAIMQVMEDAKKCLADAGSDQWQNGYPNADVIIDDIISGQAYVALEEGELLAYAAVTKSPEEAYEAIYEGNWQAGESEYLVFHRIAVAADTHAENKVMQHIFEKLGFKQVGKVPVDGERLAYQKLKK
ncbi:TPA: GNAT family N-acetyltransferase [Streptococcus pneumoniae]|uniref:GNAT family N-acetyltransferase n=1 Tax=Streptococcus pneumoniae TaxID=1313 RepID=UPI003035CC2F|nr:GNAT family N-acetyltransferase [Streptococcus pneumoniae]HEX0122933.1 GNAT family N-acetyltransferase [Streptococcus pneumoniae]HEX1509097.1 GNAT family N-acetyltransferase [Streptococcus pneumoniae]